MRIFFYILFVFTSFIFYSCEKEVLDENSYVEPIREGKYSVIDGRLKFENKKSLNAKIKQLEKENLDDLFLEFDNLYSNDFLSFRPILNEDDEVRIGNYLQKRNSRPFLENVFNDNNQLKNSNEEELQGKLEELISDDELAALLNQNGEIIIGDTLYKYTEDGLYFIHINKEDHLNKYLKKHGIDGTVKRARMEDREIVNIDDEIRRFRPIDEDRGYSGSGGYRSTNYIVNSLPEQFKDFPVTSGRQTFLGGIFGDRKVAHAYFSSHRRVKVMFLNQRYLIASRLGIKVKYQKKGTGAWWRYKADELAIGINQAFFALDHKTPNLPKLPRSTYYYNGRAYNENYNEIRKSSQSGAPSMPFNDDISVTINLPLYGWYQETYTAESLNTLVWEQIGNQIKGLMKKLRKPMPEKISVVALSPSRMYINHMDVNIRKKNVRSIDRIFNREFQTPNIILGFNDTGGVNFKGISGLPDLMKASVIKLDFYGGARRGSTWKGFRMINKK